MRTVFSHDHFGPSSIQQHGFYTALLIEPEMKLADGKPVSGLTWICDVEKRTPEGGGDPEMSCVDGPKPPEPPTGGGEPRFVVHQGDEGWVGTRKLVAIRGPDDPLHPDYREFALAVADFAVLYDPRDRETEASVDPTAAAEPRALRHEPAALRGPACGRRPRP